MYKILDLLVLCKHHIQVPHSLSGIYLHCLARDMHKTNGVTFPGSPLSMMEQELGKKLPSFSSAPYSLHKPVSDSLGLVEMQYFPKEILPPTYKMRGRKENTKGKVLTQRSHRVKERQDSDLACRDAHL